MHWAAKRIKKKEDLAAMLSSVSIGFQEALDR
jgi:hypothetical protein